MPDDIARMKADLTARLAALERQHADQMALFRAGMVMAQTEGQIVALQQILAGMGSPDATPTDEP